MHSFLFYLPRTSLDARQTARFIKIVANGRQHKSINCWAHCRDNMGRDSDDNSTLIKVKSAIPRRR